ATPSHLPNCSVTAPPPLTSRSNHPSSLVNVNPSSGVLVLTLTPIKPRPIWMAVRPDDPKFEETLLRWSEELDNEPDSDNDGTDYDDHVSIQSDRESTYSTDDSEVESDTEQQLPGKVRPTNNGGLYSQNSK
ncbi:unnamed protein product, partial [Acanthoscelides obtectus]